MSLSLSKNAKIVIEKRYLRKDKNGKTTETPGGLFERVATNVAAADAKFESSCDVDRTTKKFLKLLSNRLFLPNSPTLMNAGQRLGQLAACFVLPIEDSMESIFETLKHTAAIHKSGGGTGFSFSKIRPHNDVVLSTAGISSGPISFMSVFDTATETVKQGGTRRGANMGLLRVDHPDIEAFIESKNDLEKLNNFNISVALTREFLTALEKGSQYDLINPRTTNTKGSVSARKIFDKIVFSAWQSGEPGVVFIDRINEKNPTPHLGSIEATNPCGEQPLLPYESCTLGSIDLSKMVDKNSVNLGRLKKTVRDAVHFLDNVIEINNYPLRRIEEMSKGTRKIGLGVMGFADMLIKMEILYDSEKAVVQAEKIMSLIAHESRQASANLAKKRGNFPFYKGSIFDNESTPYMRNATTTTIAPTGTISIIADTSSGIEPIFAVVHQRHVLDGQTLYEIHPLFVQLAKKAGFYNKTLAGEIAKTGSVQSIDMVPDHIKKCFRTSHDIAPEWHVRIQSAFQKYTDNAVSKTVNFPADATPEQVEKVYRLAYKTGCKGVTIYRYGSRGKQVLNLDIDKQESTKILPRPRPIRTRGITERMKTGCGKLYVTINSDDMGMCEVFAQMGKTGGCASSQIEAAGRLISLALRSGVKVDAIAKQLIGIRCPSPSWQNGSMVLSCPDAIAQVLKNLTDSDIVENEVMMGVCPDCSGIMAHEEGCLVCHLCGFSKCS
ncbi:MAG: vitamin B12-dependent ribonucleotide reductase [Desulfobacterales bacterium]|nr:vitamin B12-dependent ribonucleotide reductase [Desulfobacterales bacterium]MDP6682471.1 vitamin B12-dependent ribonucleotide reductase [Desulfobacterales bacterium]MDP6807221.1 vitamin B12-dependent ribonucleotide reductase [Desulfobacterales bacterium]